MQELDFWGISAEQPRRGENGFTLMDDQDHQKVKQHVHRTKVLNQTNGLTNK